MIQPTFPATGEHRVYVPPPPPPRPEVYRPMVLMELYDPVNGGTWSTAHAVPHMLWEEHPPIRAELYAILERAYRAHAGVRPTAVRLTGAW